MKPTSTKMTTHKGITIPNSGINHKNRAAMPASSITVHIIEYTVCHRADFFLANLHSFDRFFNPDMIMS
jgi:hypothetical protein